MMMTIEDFAVKLKAEIINKNKQEVYDLMGQLNENVKINNEYVRWITEPVNLTAVKQLLIDNLNVPPRAMMLRTRPSTRVQRAIMFSKALENGVKHIL